MAARLRTLSLIVVGLWTGGLAALGAIAAPAAFDVLEARDPAGGRTAAGVLFGEMFARFNRVSLVLGLGLLVLLAIRRGAGTPARRVWLHAVLVTAMLAATAANAFVIAPRIAAIRDSVAGPIAALPDTDARKTTFGLWHGLSTGLAALVLAGGLVVFWRDATSER